MNETAYERLLNAAFRLVSFRPRSEKELSDFLQKKLKIWKTYAPAMVDKVIARMVEYGHVDDEKFAAWWIEQRNSFRPKGSRAIAFELKKRGVPAGIIETVLGSKKGNLGLYNELEAAKKAVRRKQELWTKLPYPERKMKIHGFLVRRGFSAGIIRAIVDETRGNRYNTTEEKNVFED